MTIINHIQISYKKVREKIIDVHKNNLSKNEIKEVLTEITDPKKIKVFPIIVNSYTSWWGRKTIEWFKPPNSSLYRHLDINISVNPELGIRINGQCYLVKLYFKADKLSKSKSEVITHLMSVKLASKSPNNTIMAVLDIRNRNLFQPTVPINNLTNILNAEIAYVSSLLN